MVEQGSALEEHRLANDQVDLLAKKGRSLWWTAAGTDTSMSGKSSEN